MILKHVLFGLFLYAIPHVLFAQEIPSTTDEIHSFPGKLLRNIDRQSSSLENALTRQTEKYLQHLAKKEQKIQKKLYKVDSMAAKNLLAGSQVQYTLLAQKIKTDSVSAAIVPRGEYMPYIDSLKGTLSFLNKNPALLSSSKVTQADIQKSLNQLQQLQAKLQDADQIKQFIQQRKEQLKNYLSQYTHLPVGITSAYNSYKQESYYYTQQVKAYKDMLDDPDKLLKQALVLLNKLPAFTNYMKTNSMLVALFNMPGSPGMAGSTTVQGMQTRDQVMSAIQNQAGASGPNISSLVQSDIQSAQGQLDQLRNKLGALGSNGADIDVPDFRPNNQKTKTFFQRIEYGTDLQTIHGSYYFPATSDVGLSIGYKLDNNNIIGIGASYKVGWGQDIRHINVSSQGAGLRSFIDIRIKKSFFASGGFEYNYQQPSALPAGVYTDVALNSWQQSGLIGLSKIVSMKAKVFKKTKIQLLWDFLSYRQVPVGQPIKFRVGYSF